MSPRAGKANQKSKTTKVLNCANKEYVHVGVFTIALFVFFNTKIMNTHFLNANIPIFLISNC